MPRRPLPLLLLLVLGGTARGADTWWRSLGPALAPVSAVGVNPQHPERVYAGTWRGFFVSLDGGSSWTLAQHGLPPPGPLCTIQEITFDAGRRRGRVYVGAGNRLAASPGCGAFKGRGLNIRWRSLGLDGTGVGAIAVAPSQPATMYVGTPGDGVTVPAGVLRRLHTRGWYPVLMNPEPGFDVSAIAIDPRAPATVYAATNDHGVAKSVDRGATWTEMNAGLPRLDATGMPNPTGTYVATFALAVDPHAPGAVYVSTLGHGSCCLELGGGDVFMSPDGGTSWRPSVQGLVDLNVMTLVMDPVVLGVVYAGTTRGVMWSIDGGADWTPLGSGLEGAAVPSLAIDGGGLVLYAATTGGVFALNVR